MKRKFSVILILCVIISSVLTAQQYQIRNVSYIIDGMTWEYSLRKNIKIETDTIFDDKNSLEKYITDLKQQFQNLRILESSTITWTEAPIGEDGIIPIDMVISVKDTINMLGVPYPKYNSNDGLQLKLKYKDYSFIGTMEELNADILYEYNEDSEHILGGGIAFSIPFPIGIVEAAWLNDYRFDFNITRKRPEFSLSTGFEFVLPFDNISLEFTLKQGLFQDLEYTKYGDELYAQEFLQFAAPITMAKILNWGDVDWTPYISGTINWDRDNINPANEDLFGPRASIGHSFSTARINWYGNFRQGASFSIGQDFTYNFSEKTLKPSISATIQGFKTFKYLGLAGRLTAIARINNTNTIGGYLRGILDDEDADPEIKNNGGVFLNIDIPIKLFQTDWCGWGEKIFKKKMPHWFHYFDFEMQIAPFLDTAISYKYDTTAHTFTPRTWYAGGFEVLVFPSKFRSIVVRASLGFDLGRYLLKDIIDQSWRGNVPKNELSIGVGLFY